MLRLRNTRRPTTHRIWAILWEGRTEEGGANAATQLCPAVVLGQGRTSTPQWPRSAARLSTERYAHSGCSETEHDMHAPRRGEGTTAAACPCTAGLPRPSPHIHMAAPAGTVSTNVTRPTQLVFGVRAPADPAASPAAPDRRCHCSDPSPTLCSHAMPPQYLDVPPIAHT
eukprot:365874-Chlamydomonas_euryale.AAC.18